MNFILGARREAHRATIPKMVEIHENSMGNKSFIDHFIVSSSFTSTITVSYDGNNLSDHKPISMETRYIAKISTHHNNTNYFLNWDKASHENIQNYKNLIDFHLSYFSIPESVLICDNYLCEDHNHIILDRLDKF